MANLLFKKHSTKDVVIYYYVEDLSGKKQFYIGIDPIKKQLSYYISDNFNDPLGVVDLSDPSKPFGLIPGLDLSITNIVGLKAYLAIKKNEFPDIMHRISY